MLINYDLVWVCGCVVVWLWFFTEFVFEAQAEQMPQIVQILKTLNTKFLSSNAKND